MDFLSKYKKIFFVLGFVLLVTFVGYLLYALFFKQALPQPEKNNPLATGTTSGGLPLANTGPGQVVTPGNETGFLETGGQPAQNQATAIAQGGITQTTEINSSPSLGATMAGNGSDLQYYNKEDGKFYRLTKDGQISALSDKIFHEVTKVVWSPDKNMAILEYPDGAKVEYNFLTKEQVTLPSHWKDFDFSPDGSKLVLKSLGVDPDNRWLAVTNSDGSKAQKVESLGEKDETVYPSWSPNGQTVAMYTEGIDFDRQEVFFVGLNNENFKSTIIEGRGFEPKWAPAGDKLLYSVYSSSSNLKPTLWIVNAQGENIGSGRRSLDVETWANKCTFANNVDLYCAVPEQLEEGAGLFPEMAKSTKDNLYKIDVQTGLKKLIAVPDGDYSMSDLIISDNGYYLYFTDSSTNALHKIKLK